MFLSQSKLAGRYGLLEVQRSIQVVWRGSAPWTVASLAIGAALAVLPLAGLYVLKLMIDAIVVGLEKGFGAAGLHSLPVLIGCALLVQLVTALCKSFGQVAQE